MKEQALVEVETLLGLRRDELLAVDERLEAYVRGIVEDGGRTHNVWEVLAVWRFLDMTGRHRLRGDVVGKFLRLAESVVQTGASGRMRNTLTPVQVFLFAATLGFFDEDGRRTVRHAVWFVPRKFGKTTLAAILALAELLLGDCDAQAYIAANSRDQANICFKKLRSMVRQYDAAGKYFRVTSELVEWRDNPEVLEGSVRRLSAGAKTKDGLNASLIVFDEYAAARYVRDHSDGAELLNVLTSSMGTRLNPLTVVISSAGRVNNGPFEQMLRGEQEALADAFRNKDGSSDRHFLVCFQPDPWEIREETFDSEDVWRKCNPHIGVTVQEDFYRLEWETAQRDPEKMKEFLCKCLDVFQSDRVRDWLTYADISQLQVDTRIDDFEPSVSHWLAFTGMDFSRGDDLCGMAYLCYNPKEKRFFADCDAWVTRRTMETNSNSVLYRQWQEAGWLHVVDGDVIPEQIVADRMEELKSHVRLMRFGYDPYDAKVFVNNLSAWVRSQGVDPGKIVRPVRQTWGQFNSSVQTLERLVRGGTITFSASPLIPWCFGNAVLDEDKFENVKPVKRSANAKIDVVICILEGLIMMEELG